MIEGRTIIGHRFDTASPRRWVEATFRFPLWAQIPPEDRVTKEMIQRSTLSGFYKDRLLERLEKADQCPVAVAVQDFNLKFMPCSKGAKDGKLCPSHGGERQRPERKPTYAELEREVERLRSERAAS